MSWVNFAAFVEANTESKQNLWLGLKGWSGIDWVFGTASPVVSHAFHAFLGPNVIHRT